MNKSMAETIKLKEKVLKENKALTEFELNKIIKMKTE